MLRTMTVSPKVSEDLSETHTWGLESHSVKCRGWSLKQELLKEERGDLPRKQRC